MNNKIVKLGVVLFLVCAIAAGVLGVTNMITAPFIEAQAQAKTAAAYAAVLQASAYEDVEVDQATFKTIDKISKAAGGEGWVVTSTFSGAQGMITMITGVAPDYTCTGISITEHSETSGLGANAASTAQVGIDFRAQFVGKDDSVTVNDIDALAGATITSRSVADAVATSIKAVKASAGEAVEVIVYPWVKEIADGANGKDVTIAVKGVFGDDIVMIVSVAPDMTCAGVQIVEQNETPGLGAVAAEDSAAGAAFRDQFIGKDSSVTIDSIDAIAGASVTSGAIAEGVAAAIMAVANA